MLFVSKNDSESKVGISSVEVCNELSMIVLSAAGERDVSRVSTSAYVLIQDQLYVVCFATP